MRPGSVAVVFGTRPEVIKLASVVHELGPAARTLHTGQHYSPALADVFLDQLDLGAPAVQLDVGGASRGRQIGDATARLDDHFGDDPPSVVVVQGDTNTALAGALAANAREIPVVHVEAGLRSFDRAMPEEHNRVVVDHLADLLGAPTETSREHALAEGIPDDRIEVTGNTVVDAIGMLLPSADERRALAARYDLQPGRFVLSTFHRPENDDDDATLRTIVDELAGLPFPVLLPLHPRTAARLDAFGIRPDASRLRIVEPIGYREFLGLTSECAFLVSDSGGVQEEVSVLKRPLIVVRRSTERPEVIGTFAQLVAAGPAIGERAAELASDVDGLHARLAGLPSPYGTGDAGRRTVAAIEARFGA
jgi:UDP-N-acetylglucosamine 2-epimerase (non-hydrolysing)